MGSPGGPGPAIAFVTSHIVSCIFGFWLGNQFGVQLSLERSLDHIAEAAAEIAFQRCQDLWENSDSGGDWPSDPKKEKFGFDHREGKNPVSVSAGVEWATALAVTGWTLLLLVAVVSFCYLHRSRTTPTSPRSSPTSDSEVRALAKQQLAELRVRRHVAGK